MHVQLYVHIMVEETLKCMLKHVLSELIAPSVDFLIGQQILLRGTVYDQIATISYSIGIVSAVHL